LTRFVPNFATWQARRVEGRKGEEDTGATQRGRLITGLGSVSHRLSFRWVWYQIRLESDMLGMRKVWNQIGLESDRFGIRYFWNQMGS
jgi:hypothetical protein